MSDENTSNDPTNTAPADAPQPETASQQPEGGNTDPNLPNPPTSDPEPTPTPADVAPSVIAVTAATTQPPATDAYVAPGSTLFSDSSKRRGISSLEAARALPVLSMAEATDGDVAPFVATLPTDIEAFRAEDGRTMRIGVRDAELVAVVLPGDAQ